MQKLSPTKSPTAKKKKKSSFAKKEPPAKSPRNTSGLSLSKKESAKSKKDSALGSGRGSQGK